MSCSKHHEPSQEEDDKLFLATGFRYLPASERGFPYPWCAKKSKKGWRIRDSPPTSRKLGVEIVGWRAAVKLVRSRDILLQRVQNREGQELAQCSTIGTSIADEGKPFKKRDFTAINNPSLPAGKNAVDHWFRHTQQVVQTQLIQAQEEEFQCFLRKKRKQMKQELRQRQEEKKKQKNKENLINLIMGKAEKPPPASASMHQILNASSLPMSPIRKKHKKMTPKRNQQNHNSIILGEDPELDQMIEDIVLEFTKEQDTHTNRNAGGVEFDGSAFSALREAARETLSMMAHQHDDMGKHGGTGGGGKSRPAASVVAQDAKGQPSDAKNEDRCNATSGNCEGETDERIPAMIEKLIGEAKCP